MKNFKTPLLIEGTPDQFDSLIPQLENLGYMTVDMSNSSTERLVTFYQGVSNQITNIFGNIGYTEVPYTNQRRLIVNASNPELVLALAAMVDDDELYDGEYCLYIGAANSNFWTGKLYKAHKNGWGEERQFINESGLYAGYSKDNKQRFKKATVEEIFKHFNMKTEPTGNMANDGVSERKIIGYKVKEGVNADAACGLIGTEYYSKADWVFQKNSDNYNQAIKLGILEQLFEPVYEDPEFTAKKGDWVVITDFGLGQSNSSFSLGKAYQLCRDLYEGFFAEKNNNGQYGDGWNNTIALRMKFRLATPEEIASAQTKIITLRCEGGKFEIEVSKKGIYYRAEDKWLDHQHIDKAIEYTKVECLDRRTSYMFNPTFIDSGCKKNVHVSDWAIVLDAFSELQNDKA